MLISELIAALEKVKAEHGDMEVRYFDYESGNPREITYVFWDDYCVVVH